MKEPIWLQKEVVIAFHEMLLAEHGGAIGLRDEGLLDSALGKPLNLYYYEKANLFDLASAYADGIIRNHPFVDGNKRTSFVSMKTFLMRNAILPKLPKGESVEMFFAFAAGDISANQISQWLKKHSKTKSLF